MLPRFVYECQAWQYVEARLAKRLELEVAKLSPKKHRGKCRQTMCVVCNESCSNEDIELIRCGHVVHDVCFKKMYDMKKYTNRYSLLCPGEGCKQRISFLTTDVPKVCQQWNSNIILKEIKKLEEERSHLKSSKHIAEILDKVSSEICQLEIVCLKRNELFLAYKYPSSLICQIKGASAKYARLIFSLRIEDDMIIASSIHGIDIFSVSLHTIQSYFSLKVYIAKTLNVSLHTVSIKIGSLTCDTIDNETPIDSNCFRDGMAFIEICLEREANVKLRRLFHRKTALLAIITSELGPLRDQHKKLQKEFNEIRTHQGVLEKKNKKDITIQQKVQHKLRDPCLFYFKTKRANYRAEQQKYKQRILNPDVQNYTECTLASKPRTKLRSSKSGKCERGDLSE